MSSVPTGKWLDRSVDSGYEGSYREENNPPSAAGFRKMFTAPTSSSWDKNDNRILRNFRFLKDEVYEKTIAIMFVGNRHFDEDDIQELLVPHTRRQRVDLLLRKLLRRKYDAYEFFIFCLKKTGQEHIADKLSHKYDDNEDLPYTALSVQEMETSILQNVELLCDDLEPDKIADYYLVYLLFTVDEYESVINHRTRRQKAEEMVGLILEKLPKSFSVLKLIYKKIEKDDIFSSLEKVNTGENQTEINTRIREQFEMKRRGINCRCSLYPPGYFNCIMELNVENPQRSRSEKEIVKILQKNIDEINKKLQKLSYRMVLVKSGSIIIHLLSCGPILRRQNDIKNDVENLLKVIFGHPAVTDFGYYNGLRFNVTIKLPVKNGIEEQNKSGTLKKEVLERNRDYLSEELSALPFVRHPKASKIFSKSEINSILNGTTTLRKRKMQSLLTIILAKGDAALQFFEMVLNEEKQTKVMERLSPKNMVMDSSPSGSYAALVDEMSPSLIATECKAVGLDISMIVEEEKSLSRKQVSENILKYALCQEHDTKQKFLWVFKENYPDLIDFTPQTNVKMLSGRNSYEIDDSWEDCFTKVYESSHEIHKTDCKEQLFTRAPEISITDVDPFNGDDFTDKTNCETVSEMALRKIKFGAVNTRQTNLFIKKRLMNISNKSDASSGYGTDKETEKYQPE